MKAVILAGGIGKRLKAITQSIPKSMIEIKGKPILQKIIEDLRDFEINEIVIVVGYMKEKIIDYFGDGSNFGMKIEYAFQKERLGTADALKYAAEKIKDNKFLVVYGDLFFEPEILKEMINEVENCDGVICVKCVDNPKEFGVLEVNGKKIKRIVEKSVNPPSNLVNAGVYILPKEIFSAIEQTKLSQRGEHELTDSIQILIDKGFNFHFCDMKNLWVDVGTMERLEEAKRILINKI